MKAVLFYITPISQPTETFLNIIKYYIKVYEYNKDVKLFIINGTYRFKKSLLKIIKEKYMFLFFNDIRQNISCVRKSDLIAYKFDTVLICNHRLDKDIEDSILANRVLKIGDLKEEEIICQMI